MMVAMTDQVTYVSGLIGHVEPFDNRPHAAKVLKTDTAHVVVFAFAAGQHLKEHAAHHAVVIQVLAGHCRFGYDDAVVDLRPGDLIHLPPMKRHHVDAIEDSTLTVTMLVSGPGGG
jgi:quercetin dioxygenase-like cupin family protein